MNLEFRVSIILYLFWLMVEVSVGLGIAGVRKADAFGLVQTVSWPINSGKSEGETKGHTTTDSSDTTTDSSDRRDAANNADTTVQLMSTPISSLEEAIPTTQLCMETNTAPDVNLITESVTRVVGYTDLATTRTIQTNQIYANAIHDATESTTTLDTTTIPPYFSIPGKPTFIEIDTTSRTIRVFWNAPTYPAGEINGYELTINPIGPLYHKWPNCDYDYTSKLIVLSGNDTRYTFIDADSYYEYQLLLRACSSSGCGEYANETAYTKESAPETPEMLDPVIQDNGTTTFYWRLPCNLNGIPDYFNLSYHGHYSLNNSLEDSGMKISSAKEKTRVFNFTQCLRLAFSYSAKLSLIIESGIESPASEVDFTTPDDVPGKPTFIEIDTTSRTIRVFWNASTYPAGEINGYELTINPIGPLYHKWPNCDYDYKSKLISLSGNDTRYTFIDADSYYEYELLLRACSSSGCGEYANETAYTKESAPDNVEDVNITILPPTQVVYNEKAQIKFKSCRPNGNLIVHNITIYSSADYDDINENYTDMIDHDPYEVSLQPEYHYWFTITIDNGFSSNESSWYSFNSTSGVPAISSNSMIVLREGSTEAEVTLTKGYLNESNGKILYIALILSDKNVSGGDFSQWNGKQWPAVYNAEAGMYYQISDDWWSPFREKNEVTFTIGSGGFRNKPLDREKEYYLVIRLFTSSFYRNSEVIYFKTGRRLAVGMLIGIVVGVLLTLAISTVLYFTMRRKMLTRTRPSDAQRELKKADILYQFIEYCKALDEDPDKISSQFNAITSRGKEIVSERTSSFAKLPENWRKNRYVNVLPYDDTRVRLLIDEDDEIGSDYINASYIEGYKEKAEYIATQGPLPTTYRDFWKMVLQENVHVIVMVSQFIVNKREKCFKYFPEKGKMMIIGDDMEIRCTTELHFGTYCVRTIQVRKGNVQATVTHMQFLEWPDFGVPLGTEHMLVFCYRVRLRVNQEGGCVIVHCSAGVGRTGTFIATDILLQKAWDGKPLDVFETVMKLREQRTLMVQTEEQYNYIYKLIRNHLEEPSGPELVENSEHIYENISVIQNNQDASNRIILESSF